MSERSKLAALMIILVLCLLIKMSFTEVYANEHSASISVAAVVVGADNSAVLTPDSIKTEAVVETKDDGITTEYLIY